VAPHTSLRKNQEELGKKKEWNGAIDATDQKLGFFAKGKNFLTKKDGERKGKNIGGGASPTG